MNMTLDKHFVGKTFTRADNKDIWQTPQPLFDTLDNEFNFQVDAFASDLNHLCDQYFTEERSAFEPITNHFKKYLWLEYDNFFANPPYSQTDDCLKLLADKAETYNVTIVALVNANTDTKWFKDAVSTANEVRLISGRVSFVQPNGERGKGNSKGQCLIIWRGNCKTPCVISMVDREFLMGSK